jgi:hypothetical protein
VRDLDMTPDELRLALEAHHTASGLGPDVVGEPDFADLVAESVEEALHFGRWWPTGTVVGRRLDSVHRRSLPG